MTLPGKEGAEQIKRMMTNLRHQPPQEIAGSVVTKIHDTLTGKIFDPRILSECEKSGLPTSDVLQFALADGSKVSVRPSGTEPKIKFYVSAKMAIDPNCSAQTLQEAKLKCQQRVAALEGAFTAMAKPGV